MQSVTFTDSGHEQIILYSYQAGSDLHSQRFTVKKNINLSNLNQFEENQATWLKYYIQQIMNSQIWLSILIKLLATMIDKTNMNFCTIF